MSHQAREFVCPLMRDPRVLGFVWAFAILDWDPPVWLVPSLLRPLVPFSRFSLFFCILYSSRNIPMKVSDWMQRFGSGSFAFLAFPMYGSTKLRQLWGSEFEIIVLKRTSGKWKSGFGNSFMRSRSPFRVSKCFNRSSLSVALAVWRRFSILLQYKMPYLRECWPVLHTWRAQSSSSGYGSSVWWIHYP